MAVGEASGTFGGSYVERGAPATRERSRRRGRGLLGVMQRHPGLFAVPTSALMIAGTATFLAVRGENGAVSNGAHHQADTSVPVAAAGGGDQIDSFAGLHQPAPVSAGQMSPGTYKVVPGPQGQLDMYYSGSGSGEAASVAFGEGPDSSVYFRSWGKNAIRGIYACDAGSIRYTAFVGPQHASQLMTNTAQYCTGGALTLQQAARFGQVFAAGHTG